MLLIDNTWVQVYIQALLQITSANFMTKFWSKYYFCFLKKKSNRYDHVRTISKSLVPRFH